MFFKTILATEGISTNVKKRWLGYVGWLLF